jgi:hypothetical protein
MSHEFEFIANLSKSICVQRCSCPLDLHIRKLSGCKQEHLHLRTPHLQSFICTETDPAKKQALLDKVMEIYDTRLKYFGAEEGKSKIIAYKVYDYMELMGEKADSKFVYEGLKEAIEEAKDKMEPSDAYGYFMAASLVEYHKDNSKKEQYLNDYFTVTDTLIRL